MTPQSPGLKYQFFHACPKCYNTNTVWNEETEKWSCTKCSHRFTDMNCIGQCGTCTYNQGPCLPGRTKDEMHGAICISEKQRLLSDPYNEHPEGVPVYRYEMDGEPCPSWARGDAEAKYLGSNSEKRVNPVLIGVGHWERMKDLGFKWDFVHIVPMNTRDGTEKVTFHKFYRTKPSRGQLKAIKATVMAAGKVVTRSSLEELK